MSIEDYDTVIGLETHVQLKTRTKMFCGCLNEYGAAPNSQVCPVCLGLPGSLPVPNREAFRLAIRAGLALNCKVATFTKFDRKNYFYPDLPKGYQISQFDYPINGPGRLDLAMRGSGSVDIERAHLEEDAGKSGHDESGATLVDLNRCGVPLLEIVTRPDIDTPELAYDYLTELKLTMRYLGVGDCDMEKGSLRCDVNVSLKPKGAEKLGTKIELKNLNSFKMARRALEYEQRRQAALYDAGKTIDVQETRLWDEELGETRVMRTKEGASDYRYFPDPDLPPFNIDPAELREIESDLPELPGRKKRRLVEEHGLSDYDSTLLVQDPVVADYFEETARESRNAKQAANWIAGEVFAVLKARDIELAELAVRPAALAELIRLVEDGTLSSTSARKVFQHLCEQPGSPKAAAEALGLVQMSDESAIRKQVQLALDANPNAVADIRAGKRKAAGAIVGQVMRETQGRANPAVVNRLIDELLG